MRGPLKEKIQNAISRAIKDFHYYDYNNNSSDGALIVGGRRRTRKKKNKKNGQNKKKKIPTVDKIKTKLSPSGCRKQNKEQDSAPLIGQPEEAEKETMPFGFLKKKDDGGIKADLEADANAAKLEAEKIEDKLEDKPAAEEAVAEEQKAEEKAEEKAAEATTEPVAEVVAPQTAVKTENSPLITEGGEEVKDSKVKDQQPGFVCCTIL